MEAVFSRRFVAPLLLAAAAIALYWNSLAGPFVLDDTASIVENPSIRQLFPLGPVLSPPANVGVGGRPVANLSFALNYALGGLDVRGYHAANLAIHLAASLALFGVTRRTLERVVVHGKIPEEHVMLLAFAITLLWLAHPLQTEAVTYISQRTEALMGLFYLLALYGFIRAAEKGSAAWAAFSVAASALGMATKEVMVTAPVVIFLYDRTFFAASFRAAWATRKRLHLALAGTWLVVLALLLEVHERGVGYAAVTWWQYALTEARAILLYLRLALWPTPLVFDYGTAIARGPLEVWPHVLALAALVGATAWALWRRPQLGFAAAWIFVILAPASSVVPVAGQPIAEHRMYLPLAGVVALVAFGAHRWFGRGTAPVLALIAVLLGGATVARNRDYRISVALWIDTVRKSPDNARAHAALGAAWLERGELQPAIASLERSLRLDDRSAEVHNNLATALLDANRTPDAIAHFTASLRLRPGTASTHYNFGNALLSVGRTSEAIAQQQQALILQPEFPEASCALANALLAAGRRPDAIAHYELALRARPDLVPAHFGLANALAQSGHEAEAVPHYETTLRAVPNSAEAHFNLGNAYVVTGRLAEAVAHYEIVLKLQPGFEPARTNLDVVRKALRNGGSR